jgi:hypothetical protein
MCCVVCGVGFGYRAKFIVQTAQKLQVPLVNPSHTSHTRGRELHETVRVREKGPECLSNLCGCVWLVVVCRSWVVGSGFSPSGPNHDSTHRQD